MKKYTCNNTISCYSSFFGETLPPPKKNTSNKKQATPNKLTAPFVSVRFLVPFPFRRGRRWLFSGRLDWWTRNHRHLNDWRPTKLLPSTTGGVGGRMDGLGWGHGWVGLVFEWLVGEMVGLGRGGCLQAIQVLQWFFYPKHSWGFQPWLSSWQTPQKIASQLRRPVGFVSWRPWWRPKSLNNRPAPDTPTLKMAGCHLQLGNPVQMDA